MSARGMLPAPAGAEGLDPEIRFMPVAGDAFEPTARPGDVWVVVPIDRYDGEGMYVVDEFGKAVVLVVDTGCKNPLTSVRVSHGRRYGNDVLSRADFEGIVLAKCVGIVRVLDAAYLTPKAGGVA
ncbi:MAG: hypothetical protein IT561_24275 [Alphaproteobacteria bacterium]|nr:hypothetical protein [Alphaproteobacteria bacterium]